MDEKLKAGSYCSEMGGEIGDKVKKLKVPTKFQDNKNLEASDVANHLQKEINVEKVIMKPDSSANMETKVNYLNNNGEVEDAKEIEHEFEEETGGYEDDAEGEFKNSEEDENGFVEIDEEGGYEDDKEEWDDC